MNYSCEALIATCLFVAGCGGGGAVGSVSPTLPSTGSARVAAPITRTTFESIGAAEAIAGITVRCAACAWDQAGSEAVVINIKLDDHEDQRLPIVRRGLAEYRLLLGPVAAGSHTVMFDEDPELTAASLRGKGAASVEAVQVEQ